MFDFAEILDHSLMITGFVFAMMLLIEYLNVVTKGSWQQKLKSRKFGQIVFGILFGAVPGCLGSFAVVSLYSHGIISFGALTATMIASVGDEAYVMFSLFPVKAAAIAGILIVIGAVVGWFVDKFISDKITLLPASVHGLEFHNEDICDCLPSVRQIKMNFSSVSLTRGMMLGMLSLILLLTITGSIAGGEQLWLQITLVLILASGLFIVIVVPEHFLEEHLWKHVLKNHLLRIFAWTFGALLAIAVIQNFFDVESLIADNYFTVLAVAVLIGLIPESGPHLIFVTLFASGSLPVGILLASSIVQDGHGTLPLIPFSRKSFVILKLINAAVGFAVGGLLALI